MLEWRSYALGWGDFLFGKQKIKRVESKVLGNKGIQLKITMFGHKRMLLQEESIKIGKYR